MSPPLPWLPPCSCPVFVSTALWPTGTLPLGFEPLSTHLKCSCLYSSFSLPRLLNLHSPLNSNSSVVCKASLCAEGKLRPRQLCGAWGRVWPCLVACCLWVPGKSQSLPGLCPHWSCGKDLSKISMPVRQCRGREEGLSGFPFWFRHLVLWSGTNQQASVSSLVTW